MNLSTKLKLTILLASLWLVASTSPAWATCTVEATRTSTTVTGEEYYSFDTTCPVGYRDEFDLKVWKDVSILFYEIDDGTPDVNGSVHAVWGPFGNGTYEAKIYCSGIGVVDICDPAAFTITGVTPPTPPPPDPGGCIETGLGCIPTEPTALVEKILQIAIGVASGIAMLLLISGAFRLLTSSGDPKAVMAGRETITSAIAGLLLILLSVAILNIIGISILNIPIWGQ